jgi:ataxia telangiectasia mutated family protein
MIFGKLYELSESMNSGATPVPLRCEKKRKLDNGISSILSGIQTGSSQHARIFNLQVLLFLIDRHWLSIHLTLKHHIVDSLLQLVGSEDTPIQIWTLLCLAAVVYAERFLAKVKDVTLSSQLLESQSQAGFETGIWDSIWTHSIRRVNSPPTCRAASHTAYTLIYQAVGSLTISLPSQRILSEIEILSSDLEVQGPAYPYDSVCNFLAQCVNLAGQDARLYRIHLEDKVVGWIVDHWKVTATAKIRSMPPTLQDGVNLLEAICGFSRRSYLVSRGPLPSCDVVTALQREVSEARVRDFLLSAQLPVPLSRSPVKIQDASTPPTAEVYVGTNTQDLSQPQARERKISAFFLRSIELLTSEWEGVVENHINVTADAAQQSLEHALTSLIFESLLVYNGVASNRHLIQASAKLISIILPLLNSSTWNYVEKATVLSALEPLILLDNMDNSKWEVVLPPGTSSGIKRRILNEIMDKSEDPTKQLKVARTNLLRILWRMPDVSLLFNFIRIRF